MTLSGVIDLRVHAACVVCRCREMQPLLHAMEPSLDMTKMLDYRYIFDLSIKKTDQSMVATSGVWRGGLSVRDGVLSH
ncbi:hypothetical protein GCM10011400_64010 [Paraburkholderia caffeinilytica]|uniref:Uncharacterized protein n=1 Tax=Paraburkholderia caffeinilytica TaxID=1761016 RepID=A0ABQ1NEQ9_9BURK|nr:hypothetical protein GCM10011400_64010 [Paraburkholderia caffeinilytica]